MNSKINLPKLFWGYGLCLFPLLLLVGPLISELYILTIIIFSFILLVKRNFIFK